MAVSKTDPRLGAGSSPTSPGASPGRKFLVGGNVILATILLVGVVVVAQMIAFAAPAARMDMTSSRINSLSSGTENLLRGLDKNIRLTSLYFETDREEKDQPRYRKAAQNLIDLYESTNRSKIKAEWVNPLKQLERYDALKTRLRDLSAFKPGIDAHRERIERFQNEILPAAQELIQSEIQAASTAGGGAIGGGNTSPAARVQLTFRQLESVLDATRDQVQVFGSPAKPEYSAAVAELRSFYPQLSKALMDISAFGSEVIRQVPDLPPAEAEYLRDAGSRYADLVARLEAESAKLGELDTLKIDVLFNQILPTGNAIVVESDQDAQVVDFSSIWPPLDQGMGGVAPFDKRAFKGEQELTSAILRTTHKEQTAVLFVRYGGQPLFFGTMPGQPPAPYSMMKEQLEAANFVVEEWDLKESTTPPTIDPPPTETLFIVLKPQSPDPRATMMGQQPQEPPFGDTHKQALIAAMGDTPRALFIAGWHPGPFGAIPATYEFNDFLKDNWGIEVETSAVLLEVFSIRPGEFAASRDSFNIDNLLVGDHPILSAPAARQVVLPWCAPLKLTASPPDGVKLTEMVTAPRRETLWGISDIPKYQQQLQRQNFLTREPTDSLGPFTLAAAAEKGDARVVVVSSRDFADDAVAFARAMSLTPQGIALRSRNPGNVLLLINSLHWLGDNMEFLNIGQPIDAAVLAIPGPTTVKTVQVLTIFAWPALALAIGGAVWLVRRR